MRSVGRIRTTFWLYRIAFEYWPARWRARLYDDGRLLFFVGRIRNKRTTIAICESYTINTSVIFGHVRKSQRHVQNETLKAARRIPGTQRLPKNKLVYHFLRKSIDQSNILTILLRVSWSAVDSLCRNKQFECQTWLANTFWIRLF